MIEKELYFHNKNKSNDYPYVLFICVLIIYIFTINSVGDKLDVYGAVIFYENWIEEIAKLNLNKYALIDSYVLSNSEIAAPEPIPGIFILLITRFIKSPVLVLHFINVLVLFFLTYFVKNTYKDKIVILLLLFSMTTGFYEYVLLHMTHRFKIAFLFFMISIYYVGKKNKLAKIFYILALLSHFSLLTVIPVIFFLKKIGFKKVPSISFFSIFSLMGFMTLVYFISADHLNDETAMSFLANKFERTSFERESLNNLIEYLPIILILGILSYKLSKKTLESFKKSRTFWSGLLLSYIVVTLSVV